MDLELRGKVAAITGGSIGIGFGVAEALAQEGVHLALCARNETQVNGTAKEIASKYGVKAIGVHIDVSKAEDVDRFVAEIEKSFGSVDILINNAGTGTEETILTAPDAKWQYYWDLQVMAAVRLSRSLASMMRQRGGGVILQNASLCAVQPLGREPIYRQKRRKAPTFRCGDVPNLVWARRKCLLSSLKQPILSPSTLTTVSIGGCSDDPLRV